MNVAGSGPFPADSATSPAAAPERSPRAAGPVVGLAIALAVTAAWRIGLTVFEAPVHSFSEVRLMPLFVAMHGLPAYPLLEAGPYYLPMYPPLSFLFFWPAVLARDPVSALRVGTAMALAGTLAPVALGVWSSVRGRGAAAAGWTALSAFVLFLHASPILVALEFIHADAVGVFFAGVGVWLLHEARRRDSDGLFAAAMVVLSLAPWAKQTFLPVLVLPVGVLLARRSYGRAAASVVATAVLQGVWLGISGATFGFRGLLLWIWEFPARNPWKGPAVSMIASGQRVMVAESLALVALLAAAFLTLNTRRGADPARFEQLWVLTGATALLLWPMAVLGWVKVGGAINVFSPPLYFLSAAAAFLLLDLVSATKDRREPASALLVLIALLVGSQGVVDAALDTRRLRGVTWSPQVVFDLVKANPQRLLFPWYPLSTYLASGQFVHSELGIRDRGLSQFPVSKPTFRAFLPGDLRYVLCGEQPCDATLRNLEIVRSFKADFGGLSFAVHEVRPERSVPGGPVPRGP